MNDLGVDGLIDAGLLTEDLEVNMENTTPDPDAGSALAGSIGGATVQCIFELAGSDLPTS